MGDRGIAVLLPGLLELNGKCSFVFAQYLEIVSSFLATYDSRGMLGCLSAVVLFRTLTAH
jgi:hypothetical protein